MRVISTRKTGQFSEPSPSVERLALMRGKPTTRLKWKIGGRGVPRRDD
jgi:hypothetical protein